MCAKGIASAAIACVGLFGHDLYLRPVTFQPKPGQTVAVEFHNGDHFPVSDAPVKVDRLRETEVRDASGARKFANFRVEGTATVADFEAPANEGCFWLVARTVPNFIELQASKFEGYLTHERLDSILHWRQQHGESAKAGREIYSKYVKALGYVGSPKGDVSAPIGLTIEIVPLANPYTLPSGENLPVRILVRGKPQPGLQVEVSRLSDGKVSVTHVGPTDANGEVLIPKVGLGLWKLHTIFMERRPDPKEADWESFWASLTFELPESAGRRFGDNDVDRQ
jgi:hypothetical protein